MSKYIIDHGTFVEISDDELMHFKYIKKERKNGRWVYYYDEKSANIMLDLQKATVNKANAKAFDKELEYHKAKKELDTANVITRKGGTKIYTDSRSVLLSDNVENAEKNYKNAIRKAKQAVRKYEFMKLGKKLDKVISIGAVKIANFFSKTFKKKKKK